VVTLSAIAFAKQKLGVTLKYDEQDVIDLIFFQNLPCAGTQKPEKLTPSKIKHDKCSPKI